MFRHRTSAAAVVFMRSFSRQGVSSSWENPHADVERQHLPVGSSSPGHMHPSRWLLTGVSSAAAAAVHSDVVPGGPPVCRSL